MMQDRSSIDVAVVGIGCRFPQARDVHEFWTNILEGKACFSEVPRDRWDHRAFYSSSQREVDKTWTARGGFIDDIKSFAALHYGVPPRRLEVMDPQHRLLIECTRDAMMDAGYELLPIDRTRTGVFTGLSVAEFKNLGLSRITAMQIATGQFGPAPATQELRDLLMEMTRNTVPLRAFSIAGSLTNMAAASISQVFDFGGPAYAIDAACAAGAVAIYDAILHLRSNLIDVAFAGGAYLNLTPDNLIAFARVGAISPSGICRPFDHRADGFVQGDGAGILMLKRLGDALRDNDRIYGVIRGVGVNNDAKGEGPMTPRVEGQQGVLRAAYRDAAISPGSVAYFEAHGTATRVGDPVEIESLGRTLVDAGVSAADAPLLGSVKGNVGHTMSTAGVAGLIKALKIVEQHVAPPLASYEAPHPALGLEKWPLRLENKPSAIDGKNGAPLRVGVSAFGFGGTNAHFVVEEAPSSRVRRRISAVSSDKPESVIVSAPSAALLVEHLNELAEAIEGPRASHASLAEVAYTLNATRRKEKLRAVIAAKSRTDLVEQLRAAASALSRIEGAPSFPLRLSPRCTIWEQPSEAPKVAFLFPGQGAQKVGLLGDLMQRYPRIRERFTALEAACDGVTPRPLSSYLYATPSPEAEKALTQTEICQPAMAALGLSLAAVLEEAGISASVSLGHSLGEFAAIAHGGILDPRDAVKLVALRGRAMAALPMPDRGAMAAVTAPAAEVEAIIRGIDGVWLCNFNHPRQVSISGTTEGVRAASARLAERGLNVQPLSVSHAFHSPLLQPMREAMVEYSRDLKLSKPRHTVASCISSQVHDDDSEHTHRVMLDHSTAPVDFARGLKQAREAGAQVFLQIGAGGMLTSFARSTLGNVETLSLSQLEGDGGLEFTRTLATLAALGVPVNFSLFLPDAGVIDLPVTPLEREQYWVIKPEQQLQPRLDHPLPTQDDGFGVVGVERSSMKTEPEEKPASSPDLLALFAQQAEVLRQHTEIIAAQNRLLLGGAQPQPIAALKVEMPSFAPPPQPISERPTLVAPATQPAPARAPAAVAARKTEAVTKAPVVVAVDDTQRAAVENRVFEIVAKVSAFPKASLRPEQKLVEELGFDSLMVADLAKALDGAYPQIGGLPQNLFSAKTTVGDIASHVARSINKTSAATAASKVEVSSELSTYRVLLREHPQPFATQASVRGQTWLVTKDGSAISKEVAAQLEKLGAEVLRVQLTAEAIAEPERFEPGALCFWPETSAEHLAAAIERAGKTLAGWIHLGALHQTAGDAARNVHPIAKKLHAPRIAMVTGLGGKLGLEGPLAADGRLLQAGLHGYAKALGRERSDEDVRAIDVDPTQPAAEVAAAIVREVLGSDATPEAGLYRGARFVPELQEVRLAEPAGLGANDVVLISGGAGDLGAKVARALAKSRKLRGLILLGRRAADDRIKALLAETGASYVAADAAELTANDPRFANVTAIVHAAGSIEDAPVEKKTLESFDRVVRAKAGALLGLMRAAPKARVIVFSSWAGRFGNAGQSDYSAANEITARFAVATGGLAIDWPPWSSSAMVAKIPSAIQNAMKNAGVTFVGDEEGVRSALSLIDSGAAGVIVVGRNLPRFQPKIGRPLEISLEKLPYLDDHRLKGEPVLPLASATDLLLAAARAANGKGALVVEDLELVRGVIAKDPQRAEVRLENNRLELRVDRNVAYRATFAAAEASIGKLVLDGDDEALPFDVATFYQRYTFHGPRLQGIQQIDRMTNRGLSGWVKPSSIEILAPSEDRPSWAADPVVLDASFQLAGYWAFVHHKKAGYPIGFKRFVQLRPFGDRPVKCTIVLAEAGEDRFAGHIYYEDEAGKPYALLEGIEGRFASFEAPADAPKLNGNGNGHHPDNDVPAENWDIAQFPEVEALDQRLQMAELIGLKNPYFAVHEGTARNRSVVDGVEMINFSSYNYLGFSGHPEVVAAAQEAIARYGTSVSASRIASGERPIHRQLEQGIAEHLGVDDSIVMVSGHATNVTTVGTLLGPDDIVFHDSLIHDSLLGGIRLSGAARRPFAHNNLGALERALKQVRSSYRRALICVEGIYSMDGDTADLPRLVELKKRHKAMLLVDEAHSIGVLGPSGRGAGHHFPGLNPRDIDIWMGTLSKSFASCGGYIAGSKALVRFLKYSAGGFVYSAGITPPNCAAALKSLELMKRHPEIVEKLRQNSRFFLEYAKSRSIDTGNAIGAAVLPAIVGNSIHALKLSAALAKRKINVNPIVYPAVEDDAARLRFFLSSTHTEEEIRFSIDATVEELDKIRKTDGQPELSL